MKIPLVGQDFTSRSPAVSGQTCINVYPSPIDDPNEASTIATATAAARGKNKAVLYGCPGKHTIGTYSSQLRGLWSGGGRCFIVISTGFILEISSAGAIISSNAFPSWTDNGLPVQMFANGTQLLIIAGGLAYCDNGAGPVVCTVDNYAGAVNVFGYGVSWVSGDMFNADGSWVGRNIVINGSNYTISGTDPGGFAGNVSPPTPTLLFVTTVVAVTSPPSYAYSALGTTLTAVAGAVLDGTFFVQRPALSGIGGTYDTGRQVNFSAVLDGTTWNGLDFFSKEGYPDYLRSIQSDGVQLYLWGTETFEVWQADPNAVPGGNPFVELIGAGGRYGNISTFAQGAIDGHIYFLGGDDRGQICAYVMNGYSPVRISTHAQEASWQANAMGANAVSYTYMEEGHSFWCINFGGQTWCFDPETGAWHQRYKWTGSAFAPYQTNLHTFIPEWGAGGMHVTAWTGAAGVFQSSTLFYDDVGTDMAWQRVLPYIYNDGKWQYFGRLDLEMETGSAPAGLPAITLDYSDDRGVTFQNPRVATVAAPIDASSTRVFWNRNGKSRGRLPRLSGAGQYRVALIDADWDITLGTV
jgi:hypothetical protein